MKHFFGIIIDFFKFPFQRKRKENRFGQLLGFLLKDFPAYFWTKPNIRRFLLFPFLLITVLFKSLPPRE